MSKGRKNIEISEELWRKLKEEDKRATETFDDLLRRHREQAHKYQAILDDVRDDVVFEENRREK